KFWSMYLADADKCDKALLENWKGDTDGILIFVGSTGLFAAVVATFVVDSYKTLQPGTGGETAAVFALMAERLNLVANRSDLTQLPLSQPPLASAERVNILWFSSLFITLICALSATLAQQWSRRYILAVQRHGPPHVRGPVRTLLFDGLNRFRFDNVLVCIISLLHLAVALFLCGLVDFLFAINQKVACSIASLSAATVAAY
ncbi:hypothetical protein K488DRAFT_15422, partial [Vararia minispora EC-137]